MVVKLHAQDPVFHSSNRAIQYLVYNTCKKCSINDNDVMVNTVRTCAVMAKLDDEEVNVEEEDRGLGKPCEGSRRELIKCLKESECIKV